MSKRCHVAMVGAGGIARRHWGVFGLNKDVVVTGVADPVAGRAAELCVNSLTPAFDDWRVMLDEADEIDALWICVPPFAHGEIERAAIERGIPFFVEKPLSASLGVAEEIGAAVAAAGLPTCVGYHWRWLDTVEAVKTMLAERPARLALGYWLDATPPVDWWGVAAKSGGQMVEQATHIFDLARWLVGDAKVVGAAGGRVARAAHPTLDIADAGVAALAFDGGAVGMVAATCLLNWRHRVELQLYGDGFAIELAEEGVMIDTGAGRPWRGAEGDPFARQTEGFVDTLMGRGQFVRCDYADALATHRLVAAASGQPA